MWCFVFRFFHSVFGRFVHVVAYVLIGLFSLLYEQTSLSTVDGHLGNS